MSNIIYRPTRIFLQLFQNKTKGNIVTNYFLWAY